MLKVNIYLMLTTCPYINVPVFLLGLLQSTVLWIVQEELRDDLEFLQGFLGFRSKFQLD
jgi:hypothetical protein